MQNIWSSCVSCTSFPSTLPAMHRIVSCVHVNVPEEACEEVVITTIAGFLLLGWDDSDEWRTTNTLFTRIINQTNWGWLAPPSASVIVSCWSSSMIYERLLFERTMNQFVSPLNQRLTVGRSNAASGHFSENLYPMESPGASMENLPWTDLNENRRTMIRFTVLFDYDVDSQIMTVNVSGHHHQSSSQSRTADRFHSWGQILLQVK